MSLLSSVRQTGLHHASLLRASTRFVRPVVATSHRRRKHLLTVDNMNPHVKAIEYAVRGPIVQRASEIEKELKQGATKPFNEVIKANIGDCHAMGQKPLTFLRQLLLLCTNPELIADSQFPDDVKAKAKRILESVGGSIGAYSESVGVEVVRQDVARYIEQRDGYPSLPDLIVLTGGASEGIKMILNALQSGKEGKEKVGVMIPIPQYPLYSATLSEVNSHQINYYLDEESGWQLQTDELKRALEESREHCEPRAMVVINPGNPTGQVLPYDNIKEIIKFCKAEGLFLLADEVYQDNIYAEGSKFHSFKKVLRDLGPEYEEFEMVSFHSTSKGYMGECGMRGGYMEMVGLDPEVKYQITKMKSAQLCSTVPGQVVMDGVVNPPQEGDASFPQFQQEKTGILDSLKERAQIVAKTFDSIDGITCNQVMGAMYAFPRVHLPEKAIAAAKAKGMAPDAFYCFALLESTGICVVPGSGFGQKEGTFHFRMTILPPVEKFQSLMERFTAFHKGFFDKYSK